MGRYVAERVASRLGKTILELGGNNAIIVTPSADLEIAIPGIVFGSVGTCGQRCTTTRRLIIHESIYDQVKTQLVRAYQQLDSRIGNPLSEGILIGPMIDAEAVKTFQNALEQIKKQGGDMASLVGPGASFEDMLAAFLFKQMRDSEKELKGLMKKYESLRKKKKGFFGGIKSAFKSLASKAVSVGGGMLGGLVGGPIGSRLGSAFGGGLGNSLFGKKRSGDIDHSRSVINFKIQQAMNKRKEMCDMISNVLKTMHDMSMTSIRNIK